MNEDETKNRQKGGSEMPDCCGPAMTEWSSGCRCGTFLKRHRSVLISGLAVAGLTFALIATGWLLGVIAFFRTV